MAKRSVSTSTVFVLFLVAAITAASSLRAYDEDDINEEENFDFRGQATKALTNRLRMSFVQCIVDQCLTGETTDQSDYVACIQEQCPVYSHRWRTPSTRSTAAESSRHKRWQYSDVLSQCIRTNCHFERGVNFYNCVYKRCITPEQPPYL